MRLKLILKRPPAVDANESTLYGHLRMALDSLPYKLPQYNQKKLLEHLCFLLSNPLFLHAIKPRLKYGSLEDQHSIEPMTPNSLGGEECFINDGIEITKLNMKITWKDCSWATQLRYGKSTLVEGRQISVQENEGYTQSFQWFCEEAKCLWYEFKARELPLATAVGATVEPVEEEARAEKKSLIVKLRTRQVEKKQRRLVKLRVRLGYVGGRPVLAGKMN